MYTYNAHVDSVYDGDTFTVTIDLGFDTFLKNQKVRMYGINAPEMRGAAHDQGVISRDALRSQILGKDIILTTIKDEKEKYGRWLGKVEINDVNINNWMVVNNYAIVYMDDGN